MQDDTALSFICAAKPCVYLKCFAFLNKLIHHPSLDDEEKFLGSWLATKCMNNESFTCSYSYEQILQALMTSSRVMKSSREIHRFLMRLRTMGFFIANIPIYYGQLTAEMVSKVYTFEMIIPYTKLPVEDSDNSAVSLPYS